MLAVILVDQRLIVEAAAVLGPFVEIEDDAKGAAQSVDFRIVHAIEVNALAGFAGTRGGTCVLLDGEFLDGREGDTLRRFYVRRQRTQFDGVEPVAFGKPVIDPVRDECDVGFVHRVTAPGQAWQTAAVEWRFPAQSPHEPGCGAPTVAAAFIRFATRCGRLGCDHAHTADDRGLQPLHALVREAALAAIA